MKVGIVSLGLVALAAACASPAGRSGTGWEVGRQWGCDPAAAERDYTEAHAGRADPSVFVPRVGWSACQLLALTGLPDEVSVVETPSGPTHHLFYRSGDDTHVVTLREGAGRSWRVSAVAW